MDSKYIIREATDADYPQIIGIFKYCWDKHFENTPEDYNNILKNIKDAFDSRQGYFNFWVFDNGEGEIYGWQCCLQVFNSPLRKGYNGEIITYVRHDKQNGLVAERIRRRVIDDILENSPLMALWTHIDPSNIVSQKLAVHWGFTKIAEIPNSPYYQINGLWIKPLK